MVFFVNPLPNFASWDHKNLYGRQERELLIDLGSEEVTISALRIFLLIFVKYNTKLPQLQIRTKENVY